MTEHTIHPAQYHARGGKTSVCIMGNHVVLITDGAQYLCATPPGCTDLIAFAEQTTRRLQRCMGDQP